MNATEPIQFLRTMAPEVLPGMLESAKGLRTEFAGLAKLLGAEVAAGTGHAEPALVALRRQTGGLLAKAEAFARNNHVGTSDLFSGLTHLRTTDQHLIGALSARGANNSIAAHEGVSWAARSAAQASKAAAGVVGELQRAIRAAG